MASIYEMIGEKGLRKVVWKATPWYALPFLRYSLDVYRTMLSQSTNLEALLQQHTMEYSYSLKFRLFRPRYSRAASILKVSYGIKRSFEEPETQPQKEAAQPQEITAIKGEQIAGKQAKEEQTKEEQTAYDCFRKYMGQYPTESLRDELSKRCSDGAINSAFKRILEENRMAKAAEPAKPSY